MSRRNTEPTPKQLRGNFPEKYTQNHIFLMKYYQRIETTTVSDGHLQRCRIEPPETQVLAALGQRQTREHINPARDWRR
jgi:hypothetical protein